MLMGSVRAVQSGTASRQVPLPGGSIFSLDVPPKQSLRFATRCAAAALADDRGTWPTVNHGKIDGCVTTECR